MKSQSPWRQTETIAIIALLIGIVIIIYFPGLTGPFLFDDTNNIVENKSVHISELSLSSLKKATDHPRPVAMLTFALDYYLHGLSPVWFRITNLIVHICTATLLYLVLCHTTQLLFNSRDLPKYHWVPAVSALLWAVHPLQIQSVTYIVQRMNSLAAFFVLLSLLCYIHARVTPCISGKIFFSISCIISALLAVESKPNAAILPLLICLYEVFIFQNFSWKQLTRFVPVVLLALLLMGLATWVLMDGYPIAMLDSWYAKNAFTPVLRLLTESRVIVLYLSLLALPLPSRLNVDHDIFLSTSLFSPLSTLFSLLTIVGIMSLAVLTVRKLPLFSFGMFWFFINQLIESTVIPLDFIFEHRNYIPSMMLIAGFVSLIFRYVRWKLLQIILVTTLLVTWSSWTWQRNFIWQDGVSLWQDSVDKSPAKARPHESLAFYLEKQGHDAEAFEHYLRAVQINPERAGTHNNLGNLYQKTGRLDEAENQYKVALKINPDYKEALNNLGNILAKMGKYGQAGIYYSRALKVDSHYAKAHANLGNTLTAQGKIISALMHYDQALELDPDNVMTLYNKSVLLLRAKRFSDAAQGFTKVIVLQEGFVAAYNNLGVALENLGNYTEAVQKYRQALELDHNFSDARINLHRVLKINLSD